MEMKRDGSDSYFPDDGSGDNGIIMNQLEEMEETNNNPNRGKTTTQKFEFQSDDDGDGEEEEEEEDMSYVLEHQEIPIGETVDVSTEGYHKLEDDEESVINIHHHQIDSDSYVFYGEHQNQGLVEAQELRRVVTKHIREVIEEVVQAYASTVTEEEMVEYRKRLRLEAENVVHKDPLALPFQYAGQTFNAQSQRLILNAFHFLKTNRNDLSKLYKIKGAQEKAAKVLNVSTSVIAKIRRSWEEGRIEQPGQKRVMKKRILDMISDSDEMTIRTIIKEISAYGATPQISMILTEARRRINYVGSKTSFRRILARMGFSYGKVDKRLVLIDDATGDRYSSYSYSKEGTERPLPSQSDVSKQKINRNKLFSMKKRMMNKGMKSRESAEVKQVLEIPELIPVQSTPSTSFRLNNLQVEPAGTSAREFLLEIDGQNVSFRLVDADEPLEP